MARYLLDVEGVPAVYDTPRWPLAEAWDTDPPRPFPAGPASRNGRLASPEKVDALVEASRRRRLAASLAGS